MKLEIPDLIGDDGLIKPEYTCDGANVSPEIIINEIPETAETIALYCHDPDAPMGDWVHWIVINIPNKPVEIVNSTGIKKKAIIIPKGGPIPEGAEEVTNDFGKKSYGGPCPPSGTHRYYFIAYALAGTLVDVTKENFLEKVEEAIIIEQAEVMGKYRRKT